MNVMTDKSSMKWTVSGDVVSLQTTDKQGHQEEHTLTVSEARRQYVETTGGVVPDEALDQMFRDPHGE